MAVRYHNRKSLRFNLTYIRGSAGDIHKESFGTLDDMMFRQGDMVPHRFILSVTKGSWQVYYPRTGERRMISAGQGPALLHRIGRSRIEAMEDGSEMLCMRPINPEQWWAREGHNLVAGETMRGDQGNYLETAYVLHGEVTDGEQTYSEGEFVEVGPGKTLEVEAIKDSRVIYLHLMDKAPDTSR